EPEKVVVESEYITNAKVRQRMYLPADDEKLPLLLGLLSRTEGARTMVFVNTKVFVERVARALERAGYRVGVLSGDVPQKKRETLLGKFQKGQLEILVATDVAARGLHIDGVKYVYNYDLPFDAEDYVHRIGRTARLGEEGDAISFACERYAISLPDIEAYIEQKIPVEPVTPDLLVAQPRKPRAAAAEEEGESVSDIFREAREQRAADEERRGGGRRSGGSGSGGSRDSRSRGPRKPRGGGAGKQDATPAAATAAPAPSASAPAVEGERAPRKRRRRRGGKRIEGGEGNAPQAAQAAKGNARGSGRHPAPAPKPRREAEPAPASRPSLLSRIGRGLKSLVGRGSPSGH